MYRNRNLLLILILLLFMAGCDSNILQHQQKQVDLQSMTAPGFNEKTVESLQDIPRLEVDLPSELRPWDTDASALRDSIANHNGRAMIGLKSPGSDRMRANNGVREALTARQFEAALQMLDNRNIEISYVYRSFGAASVRMKPDEVYDLINHPMVDYIEIPMTYKLDLSFFNSNNSSIKTVSHSTPWGIDLVNAPQA